MGTLAGEGVQPVTDAHASWMCGETSWFSARDEAGLRDFWRVLQECRAQQEPAPLGASAPQPGASLPGGVASPIVELISRAWAPRSAGEWAQLEPSLHQSQQQAAAQGVQLGAWADACLHLQAQLTPRLVQAFASEPARLTASLQVLQRYAARTLQALAS